tara:strand:- start:94092 stop:94517 length:426 start_codon:yes stop_codon:yes gene_type:complete
VDNSREKVIFICTSNSFRSQIAEGLLRELADKRYKVFSARSHLSRLHPASIKVMSEINIDISMQSSDGINKYLDKNIDIVITVCDNAERSCPTFPGEVTRLHWAIGDPVNGCGSERTDLQPYRETRDLIKKYIESFINKNF